MKPSPNLIGLSFGRLTVQGLTTPQPKHRFGVYWDCLCRCGTLRSVEQESLLYRGTKSCGCIRREQSAINISGQGHRRLIKLQGLEFGQLSVLSHLPATSGSTTTWWLCLCTCGNSLPVKSSRLRRGEKRDCGCRQLAKQQEEALQAISHKVEKMEVKMTETVNKRFTLLRAELSKRLEQFK